MLVPDSERYLSLATFRKNGKAVETPVWFAEDRGKLYVYTLGDSGKVKRLRNSPRSRIAACNVRGKVHGAWVDVSTRIISDAETEAGAYTALRRKYGLQMWLAQLFGRLSGRSRRWTVLQIDPG